MSNKRRITTPGLTHHVMSRCIEKKPLMKAINIKKLGYKAINMAHKKYNYKLISFTLMDNHFHFIIETIEGEASISRIMQYIKARVAEMYNKIMNRTGPFWNERFKDVIIEMQTNPVYYFFWLI
ncbi:transposase, partial [Candidatus Dependentiae bacterium]|nr:transposase [Candidatus Dependentiae bacterium]